jgi:hypothetical protein
MIRILHSQPIRRPQRLESRRADLGGMTMNPVLDVVIPVYNEEADLESSVLRLHAYLTVVSPFTFRITIADNASGHSDVAIGSRLKRGSRVVRGPKREFISRSHNLILRATLAARFSDAQCGQDRQPEQQGRHRGYRGRRPQGHRPDAPYAADPALGPDPGQRGPEGSGLIKG